MTYCIIKRNNISHTWKYKYIKHNTFLSSDNLVIAATTIQNTKHLTKINWKRPKIYLFLAFCSANFQDIDFKISVPKNFGPFFI